MSGTMLTVEQAELTLGKPPAKATKAVAGTGRGGRGTGQSNKLLFSQDGFNRIKNLIPLIWSEA